MYLRATTDIFRVNIASAIALRIIVAYGEADDGPPPAVEDFRSLPLTEQTGTGNVNILAGATDKIRKVKGASLFNAHATNSSVIYLDMTDGTDSNQVAGSKVTLLAQESLVMTEAGLCFHYDAEGHIYPSIGNRASQTDMEAATTNERYVTPSGMKFHPGTVKAWGRFTTGGATTAGYNVDSPTDNGTGDITANFTTDFSGAANYKALVQVEMTATTYAVANARTAHIRNGGLAAGSVRCDCIDGTTITQLVKDPSSWHVEATGDFA